MTRARPRNTGALAAALIAAAALLGAAFPARPTRAGTPTLSALAISIQSGGDTAQYSIDLTTGVATFLAPTTPDTVRVEALTWDPSGTFLIGIDVAGDQIVALHADGSTDVLAPLTDAFSGDPLPVDLPGLTVSPDGTT